MVRPVWAARFTPWLMTWRRCLRRCQAKAAMTRWHFLHLHRQVAALLAHLVQVGQDRLSLRALVTANSSMLAAKVAERSSETGEHYITRDRAEYRTMLRQAAGGGAVMSLTTLLKFAGCIAV